MIKKYMYYPLWKIEELEDALKRKELSGLRLYKIKSSWFYFNHSEPSEVNYVVTIEMARDWEKGMYDYELELLAKYKAIKILTQRCDYNIFRLKESKIDLSQLKKYRAKYLKHILLIYLRIISFMLLSLLALLTYVVFLHPNIILKITLTMYFLFSIVTIMYLLYGYTILKKKSKTQL